MRALSWCARSFAHMARSNPDHLPSPGRLPPGLVISGLTALERDSDRIKAVIKALFDEEIRKAQEAPPGVRARDATRLLPLSRVKRIMKQEAWQHEQTQHYNVSVGAVLHTAHVAQILVGVLTRLAWDECVVPEKRNTLQLKDLHTAVRLSQKFDFLAHALIEAHQAAHGWAQGTAPALLAPPPEAGPSHGPAPGPSSMAAFTPSAPVAQGAGSSSTAIFSAPDRPPAHGS